MSPLLDPAEDLDSRGVRRLAAAVITRALDDAQRGDVEAARWLRTGDAPGCCGWWIAHAGLDPEQANRLRACLANPKASRKSRAAQGSRPAVRRATLA